MEEPAYLAELERRWPRDHQSAEPTESTIALVEAGVREHPHSAQLWRMRGSLLQLASFETGYPLKESEASYRRAIKEDPRDPKSYEDLAWFLDAVMCKRRKSKRFYEKARLLRRAARKLLATPTGEPSSGSPLKSLKLGE
jgi:hypothetical protein